MVYAGWKGNPVLRNSEVNEIPRVPTIIAGLLTYYQCPRRRADRIRPYPSSIHKGDERILLGDASHPRPDQDTRLLVHCPTLLSEIGR